MNPSKKHHSMSLAAVVALSLNLVTPIANAEGYTPDFDSTELMDIINLSAQATASNTAFGTQGSDISCGQTVSGTLGELGDQQFNNGSFFNTLEFDNTNASQFYKITVNSTAFPSQSAIVTDQNGLKQGAYVRTPGDQVQYSGVLVNPGRNTIYIHSQDGQPSSRGSYTVSLECNEVSSGGGNPPPDSGVLSGTGTAQDPFISDVNTPITSELMRTDEALQDQQGGRHFVKYFKPKTESGSYDISVSSDSFTPFILVLDASGNSIGGGTSPLSVAYSEPVTFAVLSQEANTTGSFTITMNQEGGGSSDDTNTGTFDNPIQFDTNQPLNLELTAAGDSLDDGNGGTYYVKVLRSDTINGSISINVQAAGFTPAIYLFDPATGSFEWVPAGSPVRYNRSLLIVVTSQESKATGVVNFNATTARGGSF